MISSDSVLWKPELVNKALYICSASQTTGYNKIGQDNISISIVAHTSPEPAMPFTVQICMFENYICAANQEDSIFFYALPPTKYTYDKVLTASKSFFVPKVKCAIAE